MKSFTDTTSTIVKIESVKLVTIDCYGGIRGQQDEVDYWIGQDFSPNIVAYIFIKAQVSADRRYFWHHFITDGILWSHTQYKHTNKSYIKLIDNPNWTPKEMSFDDRDEIIDFAQRKLFR